LAIDLHSLIVFARCKDPIAANRAEAANSALPEVSRRVELRKDTKMSELTYDPPSAGIEKIRKSWGWFLVLGIALAVLGVCCVASAVTATFATVFVFGWLLLISGVFQLVHAFRAGSWSGALLNLLSALFRGFTGFLLIRYPVMGAEALTVVLASFLIVAGLFRATASAMMKLPRWGWVVFSGVITAVLGFMLLAQMPVSGVWFIGFAIGVDLIFDGIATIGFAAAIHHLPKPAAFGAALTSNFN
jgi:uncharacterized membrane protein HdeD (DUF308 family)